MPRFAGISCHRARFSPTKKPRESGEAHSRTFSREKCALSPVRAVPDFRPAFLQRCRSQWRDRGRFSRPSRFPRPVKLSIGSVCRACRTVKLSQRRKILAVSHSIYEFSAARSRREEGINGSSTSERVSRRGRAGLLANLRGPRARSRRLSSNCERRRAAASRGCRESPSSPL
jgi:hypothetical protein